jgi:hypothetical protein
MKNDNNLINKILNDKLKQADHNYLEKIKTNHELSKQNIDLNELCLTLIGQQKLDESIFNKLRELSISKGGFMTSKYRKLFYKKIFNIKQHKFFEIIEIQDKIKLSKENFDLEKETELPHTHKIIENDVNRSILNHIPYFKTISEKDK